MSYIEEKREAHKRTKFWVFSSTGFLMTTIILCMVGCPRYRVYQQEMAGKAEIARARENRQIKVEEALAKKESAIYLSQADSIRARGTAIANEIIANSITEPYLRWMFIDQLENIDDQIIYLPTEAGVPILEATRTSRK